jgi:molecular chaperone DnaK
LESLVDELLQKTLDPCKMAIKDAGLTVNDIDEVLLVGGQTRMPKVQEIVTNYFGKEPRKDVNPDEAVAVGAAIQAAVLSGDVRDVLLLDVTPLSLGIETMGGVMTVLIEKNTTIPTKKSQVFSTADDNQTAVTVHVLQGERKQAVGNKSLGKFDLAGIPPASRGVPQIEVAFDIDANGIMHVSAIDKATNKQQKIEIKANSGLTEAEIQNMVRDAESHAEEDKKFQELIEVRNRADGLVHATKKSLGDEAVKMEASEREAIEKALKELEEVVKGDDKDAIESRSNALAQASAAMAERLYKNAEGAAQADAGAGAQAGAGSAGGSKGDGDFVDAEFEEVKDKK